MLFAILVGLAVFAVLTIIGSIYLSKQQAQTHIDDEPVTYDDVGYVPTGALAPEEPATIDPPPVIEPVVKKVVKKPVVKKKGGKAVAKKPRGRPAKKTPKKKSSD